MTPSPAPSPPADARRIVVVTGAAQGIGTAIAERLAAPGRRLVLVDRSERVREVAARLLGDGIVADLGDTAATLALRDRLTAEYGRCDVLVNNAGINPKSPDGTPARVTTTPLEQWEAVLTVNLTAAFLLSQWALPLMQQRRWGRIVNMSSRAGRMHSPVAGPHYAASKAGLIGLTRAIAAEGGPHGVTANCIAPGRIATPLTQVAGSAMAEAEQRFLADTPVGRVGTPDEVAATAAFLVSDGAAFINGAVIDVNGGSFG